MELLVMLGALAPVFGYLGWDAMYNTYREKLIAEEHVKGWTSKIDDSRILNYKAFQEAEQYALKEAKGGSFYCNPYTKKRLAKRYNRFHQEAMELRKVRAKFAVTQEREDARVMKVITQQQKKTRKKQMLSIEENRNKYNGVKELNEVCECESCILHHGT